MSKERHISIEYLPHKKRRTLERVIRTMITFSRLETYNSLSRNFNITRWLKVIDINISNNKIGDLPMELGTLPFLKVLDLSHNYIGISNRYGWLWMKQTAIKNNLSYLDISYNSIAELPYYITELNALVILIASYNMLKYLPYYIGRMHWRLQILDLSDNLLMYLPRSIFHLQLKILDISRNTHLRNFHHTEKYYIIPSLVELSIETLERHRINYNKFLPNGLIEYLNMKKYYYCEICKFPIYRIRSVVPTFIDWLARRVIQERDSRISIEYYLCNACFKEINNISD